MSKAIAMLAAQSNIDEQEMFSIVCSTIMAAKKGQQATQEEVAVFSAIASEYKLNPLTKEIFAFNNRGAIQPIVSVDGWLKIINSHPQLDGIQFENHFEGSNLIATTCRIFRKDRRHATEVTELLNECRISSSQVWQKWPARMLRHKALIQAARVAFGFSGIIDEDEAVRYQSVDLGEEKQVKNDDSLDQWLNHLLAINDVNQLRSESAKAPREVFAQIKGKVVAHAEKLKSNDIAGEVVIDSASEVVDA